MRAVGALAVTLVSLTSSADAFGAVTGWRSVASPHRGAVIRATASTGSLGISSPSEKEIADQAMRDWLPKTSTAPYTETLPAGALRYVFEGKGTVSAGGTDYPIKPSTLVTVKDDEVTMTWTPDPNGGEFQVNSPEYWTAERIAARNLLPIATPVLSGSLLVAVLYVLVTGGS